mgnify:CR=1 FL=1
MANRPAPVTAPTGLRRERAAQHCGVSAGHFDKMVADGVLPGARQLGSVKVWLRQDLDDAMFALAIIGGEGGENSCDAAFGL